MYIRKTKGQYATSAIMPRSASLTQNMNLMHLKTKGGHTVRCARAVCALCEKSAVFHHR